jgi:hypothetical protein
VCAKNILSYNRCVSPRLGSSNSSGKTRMKCMMSVQVYPKQTRQMSIGSWVSPVSASVPCIDTRLSPTLARDEPVCSSDSSHHGGQVPSANQLHR